jgi:hypothetical protein
MNAGEKMWVEVRAALVLAAGCLLFWASPALGAPPANDDFDNREVLTGALPIEVSRSNVDATKESEEFLGPLIAAGNSVWFEWEATSDGWLTIGGCEADFTDVVGVYTGTALNALTGVVKGNEDEGPHCPFRGREYTFKAVGSTKYVIVVDGNSFVPPEGSPADTEGSFELRIEVRPPPANDDFADSTTLVTPLEEEFEGEALFFDSVFSHNWNASLESGEPEHVGGPSGASVWYSWAAPLSGEAKIGTCCGSNLGLSLYRGDSLGALQLVPGSGSGGLSSFNVSAGTTYRIVVYGLLDSGGEAKMASFTLRVAMLGRVPSPSDGGGGIPVADTISPDTKIFKRVLKRLPPIWVFRFHSTEPGSKFRCKLDKRPVTGCAASKRFSRLRPGRHVLRVFAVDAAGNIDPTPAVSRFNVPRRKPV